MMQLWCLLISGHRWGSWYGRSLKCTRCGLVSY